LEQSVILETRYGSRASFFRRLDFHVRHRRKLYLLFAGREAYRLDAPLWAYGKRSVKRFGLFFHIDALFVPYAFLLFTLVPFACIHRCVCVDLRRIAHIFFIG
jgi:hypothetical protein